MTDRSKRILVALALTTVVPLATPVAAQELSLAYQMQRFGDRDGLMVPFGVSVGAAGPTTGRVALVGQVDWSRKHESDSVVGTSIDTTVNFAAFAAGVRHSSRGMRNVTPFVEALFGAMRISGSARVAGETFEGGSETDPMLQLGAGVSAPVGGTLGAFGQIDYRRIFAEGEGVNGLRVVIGIRFMAR